MLSSIFFFSIEEEASSFGFCVIMFKIFNCRSLLSLDSLGILV